MGLDLKKPSRRDVMLGQRWKVEELRLVDAAVAVAGLTRSDFMRRAAVDMAKKVVLQGAGQE